MDTTCIHPRFLISRIAAHNPDINGRTLYLTSTGLWTLERASARPFSQKAAQELCATDNNFQMTEA